MSGRTGNKERTGDTGMHVDVGQHADPVSGTGAGPGSGQDQRDRRWAVSAGALLAALVATAVAALLVVGGAHEVEQHHDGFCGQVAAMRAGSGAPGTSAEVLEAQARELESLARAAGNDERSADSARQLAEAVHDEADRLSGAELTGADRAALAATGTPRLDAARRSLSAAVARRCS